MTKEQLQVLEFHMKSKLPIGEQFSGNQLMLVTRVRLILEELSELLTAIDRNNPIEFADAIADILYVTYGTAVAVGLDMEPIFGEVHQSNMTKTGSKDGVKPTKGKSFRPPFIREIVEQQLVPEQA